MNKLFTYLRDFKNMRKDLLAQSREVEWAHIYHDTIKGREWLQQLEVSPGRWAGNYSFLYLLVRILSDVKPKKIIEFGLGESTKVISAFLSQALLQSSLTTIEHDQEWEEYFLSRYSLSRNVTIVRRELEKKTIKNYSVNSYKNLKDTVKGRFDFYLVDGPFGSDRFSRYDICFLAEDLSHEDDFVIMFDDYERRGEKDTVKDLLLSFERKKIPFYTNVYSGNKTQYVIASKKYKYATSF